LCVITAADPLLESIDANRIEPFYSVPDEATSEEIKKFRQSLAGKFLDSFRLVAFKPVKQKS